MFRRMSSTAASCNAAAFAVSAVNVGSQHCQKRFVGPDDRLRRGSVKRIAEGMPAHFKQAVSSLTQPPPALASAAGKWVDIDTSFADVADNYEAPQHNRVFELLAKYHQLHDEAAQSEAEAAAAESGLARKRLLQELAAALVEACKEYVLCDNSEKTFMWTQELNSGVAYDEVDRRLKRRRMWYGVRHAFEQCEGLLFPDFDPAKKWAPDAADLTLAELHQVMLWYYSAEQRRMQQRLPFENTADALYQESDLSHAVGYVMWRYRSSSFDHKEEDGDEFSFVLDPHTGSTQGTGEEATSASSSTTVAVTTRQAALERVLFWWGQCQRHKVPFLPFHAPNAGEQKGKQVKGEMAKKEKKKDAAAATNQPDAAEEASDLFFALMFLTHKATARGKDEILTADAVKALGVIYGVEEVGVGGPGGAQKSLAASARNSPAFHRMLRTKGPKEEAALRLVQLLETTAFFMQAATKNLGEFLSELDLIQLLRALVAMDVVLEESSRVVPASTLPKAAVERFLQSIDAMKQEVVSRCRAVLYAQSNGNNRLNGTKIYQEDGLVPAVHYNQMFGSQQEVDSGLAHLPSEHTPRPHQKLFGRMAEGMRTMKFNVEQSSLLIKLLKELTRSSVTATTNTAAVNATSEDTDGKKSTGTKKKQTKPNGEVSAHTNTFAKDLLNHIGLSATHGHSTQQNWNLAAVCELLNLKDESLNRSPRSHSILQKVDSTIASRMATQVSTLEELAALVKGLATVSHVPSGSGMMQLEMAALKFLAVSSSASIAQEQRTSFVDAVVTVAESFGALGCKNSIVYGNCVTSIGTLLKEAINPAGKGNASSETTKNQNNEKNNNVAFLVDALLSVLHAIPSALLYNASSNQGFVAGALLLEQVGDSAAAAAMMKAKKKNATAGERRHLYFMQHHPVAFRLFLCKLFFLVALSHTSSSGASSTDGVAKLQKAFKHGAFVAAAVPSEVETEVAGKELVQTAEMAGLLSLAQGMLFSSSSSSPLGQDAVLQLMESRRAVASQIMGTTLAAAMHHSSAAVAEGEDAAAMQQQWFQAMPIQQLVSVTTALLSCTSRVGGTAAATTAAEEEEEEEGTNEGERRQLRTHLDAMADTAQRVLAGRLDSRTTPDSPLLHAIVQHVQWILSLKNTDNSSNTALKASAAAEGAEDGSIFTPVMADELQDVILRKVDEE